MVKRPRIAYVLYNERPTSGLVRTQVVSLLRRVKEIAPDLDLSLHAYWQPWVGWKFRAEIEEMSAELRAAGIEQENSYGAVIPSRHFMYRTELFPVLHRWVRRLMRRSIARRYDIIHCRGYLGSLVVAELKPEFGHKLVFDMRSLWPKEHVSIGAWRTDDAIYKMWDRFETFTLRSSDAIVGVSGGMIEHVAEKGMADRAIEIPICVDTEIFKFVPDSRRARRRELGWGERRIIAYQGSLGLLNVNIEEVAEYFAFLSRLIPDLRFLVLTSNLTVDIPDIFQRNGLREDQFAIRHPHGAADLAGWLSAADAGIHAMSPGPDSATRLGVKVVEYLSCGLPVIVNPWVGAAADLVRSRDVGSVVDMAEGERARIGVESLFERADELRQRSRAVAVERFSVDGCAMRYVDVYRKLLMEGGSG